MRVLVTGAFGNVGENAIISLLQKEYSIRCYDLKTPRAEKIQSALMQLGDFEIIWGDVRNLEIVKTAVDNTDCIVHLAAIIPPSSDRNPELTREVNVGGTQNLLQAAKVNGEFPKFIYASSIATYGHCNGEGPPRTARDPQVATDVYTETKIESEHLVKESGLPWTILRFGVVPSLQMDWIEQEMDSTIFEIPLEQRIEFIHPKDVGLAIANAVVAKTEGKVLLLGGGERCRMNYREFISRTFDAIGIGMLPESAFLIPRCKEDYFHTDWMDTTESQALLKYQTRTLDDYLKELKKGLGFRRHLARLAKPIAKRKVLSMSPYYRK